MSPGHSIAHYRIISKLGEGGMGAVYRAVDTKLNRDVAIKVLPNSFANDADRLARFTREAQVLAALNHPNIAHIYGVEDRALIMELVEGDEPKGPVSLDTALAYARQIADALEAAHEKGIVHRDLKPANIKVTPQGTIKILDFGLAAVTLPANTVGSNNSENSPTLTALGSTQAGLILGTASYMSPEQAAGKPVDKRADIWSFGVVLYELLTGDRLFEGETVAHTLADVLRAEFDLSRLPEATPHAIRTLIGRCLERNPRKRLRDIGEARLLLENLPAEEIAPSRVRSGRRGVPSWAVAIPALIAIVLAALLWRQRLGADAALQPMLRFSVDLGPEAQRSSHVTAILSPDAASMVFYAGAAYPNYQLAMRRLNEAQANLLPGTIGANDAFFSPDSQWIGFFADDKLKKISVQGGSALTICPTNLGGQTPRGAWWGEDGTIVASLDGGRLFRVPAAGGEPQLLADPRDHGDRTWRWPQILPDGDTVLFTGTAATAGVEDFDSARVEYLSIKTGKTKIVHEGGYFARYLPSGHLIYVHGGTLFAVRFDPVRLESKSTPVPVLGDLASTPGIGAGEFDLARNGIFVYLAGKPLDVQRPALWTDATGHVQPLAAPPTGITNPRFSPDGKYLAFVSGRDIAVYDVARDSTTKLTFNGTSGHPAWMPDSRHLVYVSGTTDLFTIRVDGSGQPQPLWSAGKGKVLYPTSVSLDGRFLACYRMGPQSGFDLWMLPLDSSDPEHLKAGNPEVFIAEPGHETHPMFSPDGRWIVYTSLQPGQSAEVFVRPAPVAGKPGDGGKWQISTAGGRFPVWSRKGKELFFLGADYHIMAVPYSTSGDMFIAGRPHQWSPTQVWFPGTAWDFDMHPDGKRAAILEIPVKESTSSTVHVTMLLNFFDELKRRLP